jgi:hypothetical protein
VSWIDRLFEWFGRPGAEEERLEQEVRRERTRFDVRRRRAERVLDEFHHADHVIKTR